MKKLVFGVLLVGLFCVSVIASPVVKVTPSYKNRNISPCTSGISYDRPQVGINAFISIMDGWSVEINKFSGVDNFSNGNFNSDKGDELNLAIWYATKFSGNDLKFRYKVIDYPDLNDLTDNDLMTEDVFLSRTMPSGKYELRLEVFHPVNSFENVALTVMPSYSYSVKMDKRERLTTYSRLGLQWNGDYGPLSKDVVMGQITVGAKYKITKNIEWNLLDVFYVSPLTEVPDGDTRKSAAQVTTSLSFTL